MKVLLLHEMSGVHTELKHGLQRLGVHAEIATYGDGWKNYKSDIDLGSVDPGAKSSFSRLFKQLRNIKNFRSFDVVQSISPNPFFRPVSWFIENLIFSEDKKLVYVAAGSDAIYRNYVRQLKYYPPHNWFERSRELSRLESMLLPFSTIIPVCWEYKYCMGKAGFATAEVMPFPVNMQNHKFQRLGRGKKIRFFHPLNRDDLTYDFKGTLLIKKAFAELAEKYGDIAEFICAGGMNHSEYDLFTDDVDVIVDQVYSYSYGMSAAYGLAKGKVVLSGLEDEVKNCQYYEECPVMNITPRVADIKEKIEFILDKRNELDLFAEKSRNFAEKFHDNVSVAQKFLDIYKKA